MVNSLRLLVQQTHLNGQITSQIDRYGGTILTLFKYY